MFVFWVISLVTSQQIGHFMRLIILDIKTKKPSRSIIQAEAVRANQVRRAIVPFLNDLVKAKEPLDDYVRRHIGILTKKTAMRILQAPDPPQVDVSLRTTLSTATTTTLMKTAQIMLAMM